jgi:hypothetical protein
VILVTGRIMDELRTVFADVHDHIDAIVAENGAVLIGPMGVRRLATPVDRGLSPALRDRGVAHRIGEVLIACAAADELVVLQVIRRLGYRLVRNRTELMVLPAGVTKGSGLLEQHLAIRDAAALARLRAAMLDPDAICLADREGDLEDLDGLVGLNGELFGFCPPAQVRPAAVGST